MNWRIIRTLVTKDLTLYFRNTFFAVITVLALVAYVTLYFVMPSSVDETLELGLVGERIPAHFEAHMAGEGVQFQQFETERALKEAVENGDLVAGVQLPDRFEAALRSGQQTTLTVYFSPEVPSEQMGAVNSLFRGMGAAAAGGTSNVAIQQEIIGQDMVGRQIPQRDRLLPLFAVFVLVTETMGLGSLITEEVQRRTATALIVTPVTVNGLFVSKAITGVLLAFTQGALILLLTGALDVQPLPILVTLLLGSLLVTGLAFLIASFAKDMLTVVSWGMFFILLLVLPAFTVLFPGSIADWVQVIPSYHLVHAVYQAANFGEGFAELGSNMFILLGFSIVLLGLGVMTLRRRLYEY